MYLPSNKNTDMLNLITRMTLCQSIFHASESWDSLKNLERVFMKHYAPNICLPLKITWKQDAKVGKGA